MMKGVLISFLILLGGCSNREAERAVKDLLVDPESAQFSDVTSKNGTTCGFVNSKNRMGGYVGRTAFLYADGTAKLSSPDDAQFIEEFGAKCPSDTVLKFLQLRFGK